MQKPVEQTPASEDVDMFTVEDSLSEDVLGALFGCDEVSGGSASVAGGSDGAGAAGIPFAKHASALLQKHGAGGIRQIMLKKRKPNPKRV